MTDSPYVPGPPLVPPAGTETIARDVVVSRLSEAFANDLLPLEELERRIASAYAATSPAELAMLTRDIPMTVVPSIAPGQVAQFSAPPLRLSVVFGNVERSGFVDVPRRLEMRVFAGNVELDLSQSRFAPGVTEIVVRSFMGSVEILLPPDVVVENYGESFMSSFEVQGSGHEVRGAEGRVVRISGRVILSSVEVGI